MVKGHAVFATLMLVVSLGLFVPPAAAKDAVSTASFSSLAVSGYDAVAYFTESRPVEGISRHETRWNGATWRFASAANLARFKADPKSFAPQYGGYCAWAVAQGSTASSDPTTWRIVDGKLYLNYNRDIQRNWAKDVPANIAKADGNWPKVLE